MTEKLEPEERMDILSRRIQALEDGIGEHRGSSRTLALDAAYDSLSKAESEAREMKSK